MKLILSSLVLVLAAGCDCGGALLTETEMISRDAAVVNQVGDAGSVQSLHDSGVIIVTPSHDGGGGSSCDTDLNCPTGSHCEHNGEFGGTCVVDPATCVHTTCASAGRTCGVIADVCGGTVDCGACSSCAATTAQYHSHTQNEEFTDPPLCSNCPGTFNGFSALSTSTPSNATTVAVSGSVANALTCCWEVQGANGGTNSGSVVPDASGTVSATLPVFCGTNTVRLVCSNDSGKRVLVRTVEAPCSPRDLRVTLGWDNQGTDMELHLVRDTGRINSPTDCTWYTCVGKDIGWSTTPASNPHKDVDNTSYYGPENIYLETAEPISYRVLVEYWGGGAASQNDVTLAIHEQTVATLSRTLQVHEVWYVGTVTFPQGTFTKVDAVTPCSANWRASSMGCDLPLP